MWNPPTHNPAAVWPRSAAEWPVCRRPEKQGNKNIYTPLVRRVTYCGAVSAAHLQTLYGGDLRSMVAALSDTGRITNAEMERLARWLDTRVAESPEYDYD